jgi:photosynthetic reaction center H subunit
MDTGAITSHIDVAQLVLYAFWIFLAGLILYLRSEDKREGYPLDSDRGGRVVVQGFPAIPEPKTFRLANGSTVSVPNRKADTRKVQAEPIGAWPGAPLEPTGDPMADGVGPAAYAERSDTEDVTSEGEPRILPLRVATDYSLESRDPDPRGMTVLGDDNVEAGVVADVWVDRSDCLARYLEVEVAGTGRHVLLPVNFTKIDDRGRVHVASILAQHFAGVPGIRKPDRVTLLEEDRIAAYYAGGHLYARPSRLGPWL